MILHFVIVECVPILLYGLDACSIYKSENNLYFVFTRMLMKLFKTSSTYIIDIDECNELFNLKRISELVVERKDQFLRNVCNGTALCALLPEFVAKVLLIYMIMICTM